VDCNEGKTPDYKTPSQSMKVKWNNECEMMGTATIDVAMGVPTT
jgi:hypothetical protein